MFGFEIKEIFAVGIGLFYLIYILFNTRKVAAG